MGNKFKNRDFNELHEQMMDFLSGTSYYDNPHTVYDLILIFSAAIEEYENNYRKQIESELKLQYLGYKQKYEAMCAVLNGDLKC